MEGGYHNVKNRADRGEDDHLMYIFVGLFGSDYAVSKYGGRLGMFWSAGIFLDVKTLGLF